MTSHINLKFFNEPFTVFWQTLPKPHMGPILSNINNIIGDDTFRWNEAGQSSHANGATLSCLRIWVIRLELWLKLFPQTRHWCGFSPENKT